MVCDPWKDCQQQIQDAGIAGRFLFGLFGRRHGAIKRATGRAVSVLAEGIRMRGNIYSGRGFDAGEFICLWLFLED